MARSSPTRIPRRPVLLAGVAALAAPALSGALAGCAEQPPDPLIALAAQARADAALAEAATGALRPDTGRPDTAGSGRAGASSAEVLAALAAARRAHAQALTTELGDDAPPAPGAEQPAPPTPAAADAVRVVTAALDEAQRRAADAVPGLPRQRAALVGSIAACCGAYRAVLG